MSVSEFERHFGELIRQARRQRNLTQTALGGNRYSKSYVSAVERNKIVPSSEALQFFAHQLDQSDDYFAVLFERTEGLKQLAELRESNLLGTFSQAIQDEELTFLDIVLESAGYQRFETLHELPMPSPEVIATLPPLKQTLYYLLIGLLAQNRQDYSGALHAFECALALAPARYEPAILDELGYNYYLTHHYHTALSYHLRALASLQIADEVITPMQFKVEQHCGDDYFALGAYKQARDLYERARSHLNGERDMKTAGLLYFRLGYCMYALISQMTEQAAPVNKRVTPEEMELQFQRAMGYLVQSKSVFQVSGDLMDEARARLTLALTELDFSLRQRLLAQAKARSEGKPFIANYASLLDDAEEQCRQVLLAWQDGPDHSGVPPSELDTIIYVALAYLIRTFTQRAVLARLSGYGDTSFRERALASYICQQALNTFYESSFLPALIQSVPFLQADSLAYRPPALPRLPVDSQKVLRSPISQVEIYFAAGELAEELGRAATSHDYASDCYMQVNQFIQAALDLASSVVSTGDREPGYFVHCYQRCVGILEERSIASPDLCEETTRLQVDLLKSGLYQLQHSILAAGVRG